MKRDTKEALVKFQTANADDYELFRAWAGSEMTKLVVKALTNGMATKATALKVAASKESMLDAREAWARLDMLEALIEFLEEPALPPKNKTERQQQ